MCRMKKVLGTIDELCTTKDLETQYRLLKEAQRYSVNVYSDQFNRLIQQKSFMKRRRVGIFYLDKQYYSVKYGLSEKIVNEMEIQTC